MEPFWRFFQEVPPVIPEEAFIEAAEALFLELDAREAQDTESSAS